MGRQKQDETKEEYKARMNRWAEERRRKNTIEDEDEVKMGRYQ